MLIYHQWGSAYVTEVRTISQEARKYVIISKNEFKKLL